MTNLFRKRAVRNTILSVSVINMLFWIFLWTEVIRSVQPYQDHMPNLDEMLPLYKFGSVAIPAEIGWKMPSLQAMRAIHQPTYWILTKAANLVSNGSWNERWGPLSIGSLVLVLTMLLSFVQWGMIAWIAVKGIERLSNRIQG
jgi:hypothetical protein